MGFTPDDDLQRVPFVQKVLLFVLAEPYPDLPAAESERERELFPGRPKALSVEQAECCVRSS